LISSLIGSEIQLVKLALKVMSLCECVKCDSDFIIAFSSQIY